jgi:hypothetical protein
MAIKASSKAREKYRSALGAPSQHNQGSRKGKRAWRKHVDIQDVEAGLESLRAEERVTGYASESTLQVEGALIHSVLAVGPSCKNRRMKSCSRLT